MFSESEQPRLPDRLEFPWLVLFRAGGLAVGWPQLGISFVAVVIFWLGTSAIGWWSPRETPGVLPSELISFRPMETEAPEPTTIQIQVPDWTDWQTFHPWNTLLTPWISVAAPIHRLILFDHRRDWGSPHPPMSRSGFCLNLAWSVAIWALFGTAICRAAAVQFAADRRESFPLAVRFAAGRWFSAIGAPSIPALGMLTVFVLLVIAAWFGRLPGIGTPLLQLLSPLLFLAGLTIALLALLIICGWPLMVAAMAVEDCDGFGALSRTFSFLMGRPAQAVGNVVVSVIYGTVLVAVVGGVLTYGLLAESGPLGQIGVPEKWAAVLQGSHFSARLLLATFAVSLFWSLVTLNYLLLRQAVDQKPMDDIAAGLDDELRRGLPVMGIPATDYRPGDQDGRPKVSEAEAVAPAI